MDEIQIQNLIDQAIATHRHSGIGSIRIDSSTVNAYGITIPTTTTTSSITLSNQSAILVDSTGGAVTITLPTAVGVPGRQYIVKDWKGQAATKNILVNTTGGQTIDGAASKNINTNYAAWYFISDGANWSII